MSKLPQWVVEQKTLVCLRCWATPETQATGCHGPTCPDWFKVTEK